MAENWGPRPTALYLNPRNNGSRNNEARLYNKKEKYITNVDDSDRITNIYKIKTIALYGAIQKTTL